MFVRGKYSYSLIREKFYEIEKGEVHTVLYISFPTLAFPDIFTSEIRDTNLVNKITSTTTVLQLASLCRVILDKEMPIR